MITIRLQLHCHLEGFCANEQVFVQDNVLDKTADSVRENKVDVRRNKIIELLLIDGSTTMDNMTHIMDLREEQNVPV